jgi:FkbM family methyltransferase
MAHLASTTPSVSGKTTLTPNELDEHKKALVYLGSRETDTGWYVDSLCLKDKKSIIVYDVGIEEDITWDISMIEEYGATVELFDPTEKSAQYTENMVEKYDKLSHTREGLSTVKGKTKFAFSQSVDPEHSSLRQVEFADRDMKKTVTLPVNTLKNWMKNRKHQYLDILKLDIEGMEYGVLESLLASDFLPFTQLLVEYHARFLSDKTRHENVVRALKAHGFVQLWSQNNGQDVGYIKAMDVAYCLGDASARGAVVR